MDSSTRSQRLVRFGIGLFLAAVVLGLFIQKFTVPRIALSAHLIGILQGLFLVVLGLLWSRIRLTPRSSGLAFWLLVYQALAAFLSNVLAAAWGAGSSIIPIAAGAARGSRVEEAVVNLGLRSAGAALILGLILVLWGLRRAPGV